MDKKDYGDSPLAGMLAGYVLFCSYITAEANHNCEGECPTAIR